MTISLTGVDVRVLVHELQEEIEGTWIVNIYHLPSNIFIFKLRKSQEGLRFLLIEPGKRIHLTNFNRLMPSEPTKFCSTLRKHLRDKRINSIQQRDLDRIVILNIGPDPGLQLVIDLFSNGNLVMVSPDGKILSALWFRKMKDRDIHPGKEFIQMPSVDRDLLRNGITELDEYLNKNDKLIVAMNSWMGLGPYYSRLIVNESKIKSKNSKDLVKQNIDDILFYSTELKNRLERNDYSPVVFLDKSKNQDITDEDIDSLDDEDKIESDYDEQWEDSSLAFNPEEVIKIQPWLQSEIPEDVEIYEGTSLNEILDIFYSSQETSSDLDGESEQLTSNSERLQNQLQQQLEHQENLIKDAERYRTMADALYSNFKPASELISTIYDARKNNMSWDDINLRLETAKTKGIKSAVLLDKVLEKSGVLILKLPLGESLIESQVDFRISLTDNANNFYQKAKKAEHKAKGADIAINMTKEKILTAKTEAEKMQIQVSNQASVLKRRKSWYEKWHWAFSDDGTLIIGGLDANSNEQIVKKYLEEDDIFMHADIQGAAATVIKTDGKSPNLSTLKCAATMAVSYSSAWKLNRPIADAFFVEKDQVSFTPPTGQFLPKGSFMIYGEKNYLKDIPLQIYIGIVVEKNWARLATGSLNSLKEANLIVKIIPGEIQRGKIAKMIKQKFVNAVEDKDSAKIKAIDIGDIAQLIPGDSKIDEWITKSEQVRKIPENEDQN